MKKLAKQAVQGAKLTSINSPAVKSNLTQVNAFRNSVIAQTPGTITAGGGTPGQMAKSDTTTMPKKKDKSFSPTIVTAAAYALFNQQIATVGELSGNKAASNAAKNSLQQAALITGTASAAFDAFKVGASVGGKAAAAIGSIAAVAAVGAIAYGLALENQKMLRNIENRQAQSTKDSQRLGYISYSKGR